MRLNNRIIAETGTPKKHIEAAASGIELAMSQLHIQFDITALREVGNFPSLSTGQVDARVIEGHRPWDGGGLNLWLTGRDLSIIQANGQPMNYIFGVSSGLEGGHMITSGVRLDREDPGNPTELMTTVLHESGHTLGLVSKTSLRHDTRYGFSGHCANECIMEASNSRPEITAARDRLLRNIATAGFCNACQEDLGRVIRRD